MAHPSHPGTTGLYEGTFVCKYVMVFLSHAMLYSKEFKGN